MATRSSNTFLKPERELIGEFVDCRFNSALPWDTGLTNWPGESLRSPDSLAEKGGFEPAVLVHLCFALIAAELAEFSGEFTIDSAEMLASTSIKTSAQV
jgi:hypothetical protein